MVNYAELNTEQKAFVRHLYEVLTEQYGDDVVLDEEALYRNHCSTCDACQESLQARA